MENNNKWVADEFQYYFNNCLIYCDVTILHFGNNVM